MKKFACLIVIVMVHAVVCRAQNTVVPVGDVEGVSHNGNQLNIRAAHAFIAIRPYSPSIIRVRMTSQPPESDFSYAVTGQPLPAAVQYSETPEVILLQTDSVKLTIRKHPFSISFYTLQNEPI